MATISFIVNMAMKIKNPKSFSMANSLLIILHTCSQLILYFETISLGKIGTVLSVIMGKIFE